MIFKCNYCEKEPFNSKKVLKNHLIKKHGRKILCFKCTESFLDQESLAKHVSTFCNKKRKTRKVFPCSKCDVVLMTDESYQNHLTKIHEKITT